jgi:hypothetical protein
MYASGVGRWLTPDPLRACPLHPQNFDRYAYVGNSPTNRIDPHGDAVYPGFDYPYIDYGYGYYPPGYGYDEFDYLINFGVVPDYPSYGCDPILGCGYGRYYSFGFEYAGFLSCPGTTDCSYYRRQCNNPSVPAAYKPYYCSIAPPVCSNAPDLPYTNCVRVCLQTHDTCWQAQSTEAFYACITKIHAECFTQCLVCNFAPVIF